MSELVQNQKEQKNQKIDERVNPQSRHQAHVHYVVAFCGGFLGIFPILNVVHLLGSAQTSNLIDIVTSIIKMDWNSACLHAIGALLYVLAVFLVTFIPNHTRLNVKLLSLGVDVAAAFVMWRFPLDLPATVYLFPTFFCMAFQWSAFGGAYGYVSSTIFSTNNLKQLTSALTEAYCNGKAEFVLKAKFFGATLVGFHLGVAASFVLWQFLGNVSFLGVIVPAGLAAVMILKKP
ncbi:MAG: DUF1275 domain-containing protein [Treponema sp.]|nr:DUF1275 domain-containing protein [Candidatus Treponema equifaecale]